MISKGCGKCNKVIEGYTEPHVSYLMSQHLLTHPEEKKEGQ